MSSYFPNSWTLSYLNLTKNMKTYIRSQQHKAIKQKEPPQKYRLGTISNIKLLADLNQFFSHLGFWSMNLFLIAPFPDLCLLVPFDWIEWTFKIAFTNHCSFYLACNDRKFFSLPLTKVYIFTLVMSECVRHLILSPG